MLSNLSQEYKDKLKAIYVHFGEINQRAKLLEELEEVEKEISNYAGEHINYDAITDPDINIDKLLEEIADCYVVATQIDEISFVESLLGHICEGFMDDGYIIGEIKHTYLPKILEIAKFKIDRTLDRIDEGYYEPRICPECCSDGFLVEEGGTFTDCKRCGGTGYVGAEDL